MTPESGALLRTAGDTSSAVDLKAGAPGYSHILTVRTSSNRRHTLTGIGMVVCEISTDTASRRIVLRHAETHWHSRHYEVEALAVVRALEVALEHGYRRLLFQSPYYSAGPRLRRHPRYPYWDDSLRARFGQLLSSFVSIHFGAPSRAERTARKLARRACANASARPPRELVPDVDNDNDDLVFVDDLLDEASSFGALNDDEIPF